MYLFHKCHQWTATYLSHSHMRFSTRTSPQILSEIQMSNHCFSQIAYIKNLLKFVIKFGINVKFGPETNLNLFLNCYLAAPRSTLDHSQGDSLTSLMLTTAFFNEFWHEDHRVPRNEVGSLSPTKHQVGFEPETSRF